MTTKVPFRRRVAVTFWRIANPMARLLAGFVPWWVLLETTGRRSGARRVTPLAAGPSDPEGMWLIAVHGRHASWVRNIEASPAIRLRHRGRWRPGSASTRLLDRDLLRRFNLYARSGARGLIALDPLLVRVTFELGRSCRSRRYLTATSKESK